MKDIPASIWTLLAGAVVMIVSFWAGQNYHLLLPEQASEQAPMVDSLFKVMVTIGTALFLVVQGAILLFFLKFRQPAGDGSDGVPVEGNVPLEILWTAVPALIVIGLGVYSVDVYERMGGFDSTRPGMMAHHHHGGVQMAEQPMRGSAIAAPLLADAEATGAAPVESPSAEAGPSKVETKLPTFGIGATPKEANQAPDLVVNVTGLQYAWLFNYPDSGVTAGELHVPIGKDVKLNISAQDVIHSFWVPQFRMKQDAIPGQATELRFIATKLGTYPVICTELCGSYHGSMRTQVVVHSEEDYQTWLEENRVAQQADPSRAIALRPAELSDQEFLAPYGHEMGIDASTLAQLHHHS
jgi:cytochrome c oxidase subunit 2